MSRQEAFGIGWVRKRGGVRRDGEGLAPAVDGTLLESEDEVPHCAVVLQLPRVALLRVDSSEELEVEKRGGGGGVIRHLPPHV